MTIYPSEAIFEYLADVVQEHLADDIPTVYPSELPELECPCCGGQRRLEGPLL